MRIPRDLTGRLFAACLCKHWGYVKVHQQGSHIILQTEHPSHQRIPVPDHSPLRIGTLAAILRHVAEHKGVTRDDILATL
jgi:predicted RNA binding protein YcfA (HicA-like mRNA interferase family)